jgi:hypothetical protein
LLIIFKNILLKHRCQDVAWKSAIEILFSGIMSSVEMKLRSTGELSDIISTMTLLELDFTDRQIVNQKALFFQKCCTADPGALSDLLKMVHLKSANPWQSVWLWLRMFAELFVAEGLEKSLAADVSNENEDFSDQLSALAVIARSNPLLLLSYVQQSISFLISSATPNRQLNIKAENDIVAIASILEFTLREFRRIGSATDDKTCTYVAPTKSSCVISGQQMRSVTVCLVQLSLRLSSVAVVDIVRCFCGLVCNVTGEINLIQHLLCRCCGMIFIII